MKIAFVYLNNDKYVSRGAGYIASAVLEAGHRLDFYDTAYQAVENVAVAVKAGGYDVLLLSASTLLYPKARALVQSEFSGKLIIVLGGLHATIAQGDVLEECPDIDYICVGEGEEFIVEFLSAMDNGGDVRSIDNLGYLDEGGAVVLNRPRPTTDLSTLPYFAYDLFPQESVINGPKPGFCYVYATRGCPYRCSYCCNGCYLDLYGKDYLRTRNVDSVISELLYLKGHYPVEMFYFGDEMILFDEEYVTELFGRVKSEVGVPYGCMARVERITPSIVELLRETGCKYVGLGVECGDEAFRREFLGRRMTNEQIVQAFAALRAIPGMMLLAFYMKGFPVPNDRELTRATAALSQKIQADINQTTVFYPFRGTKLYDYCMERDLIDPEKVRRVEDVFSESVLRVMP